MRLAHARGIYVLLDECYVYLTFTGAAVSGGTFTDCKEHVVDPGVAVEDLCDDGLARGVCAGAEADYLRR